MRHMTLGNLTLPKSAVRLTWQQLMQHCIWLCAVTAHVTCIWSVLYIVAVHLGCTTAHLYGQQAFQG